MGYLDVQIAQEWYNVWNRTRVYGEEGVFGMKYLESTQIPRGEAEGYLGWRERNLSSELDIGQILRVSQMSECDLTLIPRLCYLDQSISYLNWLKNS